MFKLLYLQFQDRQYENISLHIFIKVLDSITGQFDYNYIQQNELLRLYVSHNLYTDLIYYSITILKRL